MVAREIEERPSLLLVGQPTRGVDIGAIEFIHQQILALRDRGKAILLVSVELDEILGLSDRIAVVREAAGDRFGDIELNAGASAITLTVTNTGDRPVQVGSHYHFFEANPGLRFDRARGVAPRAGDSEPGEGGPGAQAGVHQGEPQLGLRARAQLAVRQARPGHPNFRTSERS